MFAQLGKILQVSSLMKGILPTSLESKLDKYGKYLKVEWFYLIMTILGVVRFRQYYKNYKILDIWSPKSQETLGNKVKNTLYPLSWVAALFPIIFIKDLVFNQSGWKKFFGISIVLAIAGQIIDIFIRMTGK